MTTDPEAPGYTLHDLAADAVASGRTDDDLPDHDDTTMRRLFALRLPDWTDRDAVAEFAAARAKVLGDDPATARHVAARIWDRTPSTQPPVQMANQMGMVFPRLNCDPRWRERLPEIDVPTLVVHSRRDPFFPVGNGEAIARAIHGARLLVLDDAATTIIVAFWAAAFAEHVLATFEDAVQDTVRSFIAAYEAKDVDGVMAHVATDDDVVLIGTGADEKRIGPAQVRLQVTRDYEQTDKIAMRLGDPMVSARGDVAWLTGDLTFDGVAGGEAFVLPGRFTAVFEKRGDAWLMVNSHFSAPMADQAEGESFPS